MYKRMRGLHPRPAAGTQLGSGLLAGLLGIVSLCATAGTTLPDDLTEMSLEALMNIEVTSVSKRPEKQIGAAAAIFVITQDDLHRWGVTNIPEALRRVPGLNVARIDANKWAITARGFNSRFANKLLVLIDGRSVYTPLFAGVYWESQEVVLEDIDRIEVIRGPGGTLWGANAVNGVINIITKPAAETQGSLVSVTAGNEINAITTVRQGGTLDNGGAYRVYAQYTGYDEGYNADGAHDDWRNKQVGFRSDWDRDNDDFTLQGDYYHGTAGQLSYIPTGPPGPPPTTILPVVNDTDMDGGNLLFRWARSLGATSDLALQLYYDHVGRDGVVLFEDRDTFDIDFQHQFIPRAGHDIIWGLGFRHIHDDTDANPTFSLQPSSRDVDLYSAFIQDEIIMRDDMRLTLGSKFEQNDFSGYEYQPNVRLAWEPKANQTVWGAISRSVRTPARGEHDVRLRLVPPAGADPGVPVLAVGNDDYGSEELIAYELGYRLNYHNRWSLDTTVFYNDYDKLRTLDPVTTPPADVLLPFANNMSGETHGLELAAQWRVRPGWLLNASYTWLGMDLKLDNGSMDTASESVENASPNNSAVLWSSLDLEHNLEFDSALRYVGNVKVAGIDIDSYVALDLRLGWKPKPDLELSLIGQNLTDGRHPEFLPDFIDTQPTEVKRNIYARLIWHF